MTNSYNFQGGTFDPVEQVDVIPEQQALNNKIERSEQEYFDALRQNDRNRITDSRQLFDQLGNLSKSIKHFADEAAKKKKEEDEARGAMAALTSDYDYEDIQRLLNEEEVMKSQDIKLSKIGTDIENETGRFMLGEEVRNMSGWEKYSFYKTILQREAKNYEDSFIKQQRALGELDHPDSSVVNLQNVSHNVTEMHFEGDNLLGTVEILTTPSGNILRELFKNGIKLGISSRGMGSVEAIQEDDGKTPVMKVGNDFELIAFDFVSNPSTHGAFLHPVNEGVEQPQVQGRTCGTYCKAEDIINKIIRGE